MNILTLDRPTVSLTPRDKGICNLVGDCRDLECQALGKEHKFDLEFTGQGTVNHHLGTHAEMAFAKWMGFDWFVPSLNIYDKGFDCANVQVRSHQNNRIPPQLKVRGVDDDDKRYVLSYPLDEAFDRFCISGWALGSFVKANGKLDNRNNRPMYRLDYPKVPGLPDDAFRESVLAAKDAAYRDSVAAYKEVKQCVANRMLGHFRRLGVALGCEEPRSIADLPVEDLSPEDRDRLMDVLFE